MKIQNRIDSINEKYSITDGKPEVIKAIEMLSENFSFHDIEKWTESRVHENNLYYSFDDQLLLQQMDKQFVEYYLNNIRNLVHGNMYSPTK